jgi:succinate dehydrogenase / fumarate reductase cytochrome b subunit
MVNDRRPVNLNLLTIRQPITAVVSILHRISGLLLFLSLPLILWALGLTLSGPEGFNSVASYLQMPQGQVIFMLIWAATAFHLCAGFRHIIMDSGWAESLPRARMGAYIVMILSLVLVFLGGIWLC